jgi:GT2 family glycosyltransferase
MISIVICSITPARYSAVCENLRKMLGPEQHEFIGIHDATSLAEGYNRGIRQSRGETIIVCHDDIEVVSPKFKDRLLKRLTQFDLIGVAGSNRLAGAKWFDAGPPYVFGQVAHILPGADHILDVIWSVPSRAVPNMVVLDGLFMAGRREVFEKVPFDEQTFTGFHIYDMDFTLRAYQAGYKLAVCTDFILIHCSPGHYNDTWAAQAQKFVDKHRAAFRPVPKRWWRTMQMRVPSREDLLEVMEPSHLAED